MEVEPMKDKDKPLLTLDTEAPAPTLGETTEMTTAAEEEEPSGPWYTDYKNWLKLSIVIVLVIFIILAIVYNKTTVGLLKGFLEWMQNNAASGAFAFIGVYWFCTVMFIPGSILTLGAGAVFAIIAGPIAGVFLATAVVWVGAGAGASTAFLLGRFVLRDNVAQLKEKYEKFKVIDKVVQQQGLKVTVLLRLSPVIPFSAFNYIMGLTGVSFRDYNLAHVGMLPGTLAYCFIGGTIGSIGDTSGAGFDNPLVIVLTVVGTILAVIGMVYISIVAKREFAKIADENADEEQDAENPNKDTYQPPTPSASKKGGSNGQQAEDEDSEPSLSLGNQ